MIKILNKYDQNLPLSTRNYCMRRVRSPGRPRARSLARVSSREVSPARRQAVPFQRGRSSYTYPSRREEDAAVIGEPVHGE